MSTIHDTGFGDSDMGMKAKQLFLQLVAPILTDADYGKYVVIDTETGDFEIDANHYAAAKRAMLKRPGARTRFGARVGYRAVYNNWATFPAPHVSTS